MADHFVIDGSNLATEGRTEPSLAQLKEAVAAFHAEHPGAVATVVVDASFEHRIDPSERAAFAKTEAAGEVVSPPAGAVGRGDGFLLQIADRTGGTVLSNDSVQEFHAEYEWLFEPGRLIGAKPVPGVGWIFSLRRPVRGIVSRKTVQKAKQEAKDDTKVKKAIAEATASALQPDAPKRRRRRGGRGRSSSTTTPASKVTDQPGPEAVNEPAAFLRFVIDHRLGTEVSGTVDAFASHGAFVNVDGVRCYVPLSAMGNPQPNRARDVLTKDETRTFVVQAVDAPRRGIELGLPGFATIAGAPSDETVAAEVGRGRAKTKGGTGEKSAARKPAAKKAVAKAAKATASARPELAPAPHPTEPPRQRSRRGAAESPAVEPVAAVAPPARQSRAAKKKATKQRPAKKITAKKATATTKQAPAKKTAAKKQPAPAKKATNKTGAGTPAKKAAKIPSPKTPATKATTSKAARRRR